jgi:hypothetical protein
MPAQTIQQEADDGLAEVLRGTIFVDRICAPKPLPEILPVHND